MYALKHIRHSLCHFKANKGVKINTGAIIIYVLSLKTFEIILIYLMTSVSIQRVIMAKFVWYKKFCLLIFIESYFKP